MPETIGVFVAWPYANGDLHLGHIAGACLPADVFARYHRLRGNRVLMVSGSDVHGTPITIAAEQEGVSPEAFVLRHHRRFLECWQRFGISYDLFTQTHTDNHIRVAQDLFQHLYEHGYITLDRMAQLYCERDSRFLPDRYVEGTCPYCGYANARGDQCDNCGRTYEAVELIDPRCRICGQSPVVRNAEHFFFDLPRLQDDLQSFVSSREHWRSNVRTQVQAFLNEGLRRRPVSRDLKWGVPIPLDGYREKVMYVWFEAVIGYLSASVEWAEKTGAPDAWRDWWFDSEARGYYFIGKDNIPFHTIIWPAELMGYDARFNLPYDVPANEFLNLEGRQFSTSRNWAVWLPDYLERFAPDPLRYYLISIAPETRDSEFTWQGFVDHNNHELVATWGNLVNRVLNLVHRHWGGAIPEPSEIDERDRALLRVVERAFESVGDGYEEVRLRDALHEAFEVAREVNRYLEDKAPWFQVSGDRDAAATSIYVSLSAIDSLKVLLAPVLPFTCERLHRALGYSDSLFGDVSIDDAFGSDRVGSVLRYLPLATEGSVNRWTPSELRSGQATQPIAVLFEKLDDSIAERERQRLLDLSNAQ